MMKKRKMFIKKSTFTLLLFVFVPFVFACGKKQPEAISPEKEKKPEETAIHESVIRDGLPNFFRKLENGKNVSIAYFGGSITEMTGWRDKTFNWIKNTYPSVSFTQIMASVAGTGSQFGVYRADEHLLSKDPDLVFVEFSTNDWYRTYNDIQITIEGIIRKIWKKNPKTDICFVHTVTNLSYPKYKKGEYPTSAKAIEDMAAYYKIPSINFAPSVIEKIESGKMAIDQSSGETDETRIFANDGTHPTNAGHEIYKEAVIRSLKSFAEKKGQKRHQLPANKQTRNLELAKMIPADSKQIERIGEWKEINSTDFNKYYDGVVLNTANKNAVLKFTFEGSSFGIADYVGPKATTVQITIDGKTRHIERFDDFCSYYRMNYHVIDNLPDGKHHVEIKISSQKPDKVKILNEGYFHHSNDKINSIPGINDYELLIIGLLYL